jgi:hypothetical protein
MTRKLRWPARADNGKGSFVEPTYCLEGTHILQKAFLRFFALRDLPR